MRTVRVRKRRGPARSGGAGSDRLDLDLRAERKRTGLEREPGRSSGDVMERPSPPLVDGAVVADVSEDALHVKELADREARFLGDVDDVAPGAFGLLLEVPTLERAPGTE